MLQIFWDTRGYFFWLLVISISCWALERLMPWRPAQRAWRDPRVLIEWTKPGDQGRSRTKSAVATPIWPLYSS